MMSTVGDADDTYYGMRLGLLAAGSNNDSRLVILNANFRTQVDELKPAGRGFRRNVQADHGAQSTAVALSDVRQIQHDPVARLHQLPDLRSKNVSALERQPSSAMQHDRVWLDIYLQAKLRRSGLRHSCSKSR